MALVEKGRTTPPVKGQPEQPVPPMDPETEKKLHVQSDNESRRNLDAAAKEHGFDGEKEYLK